MRSSILTRSAVAVVSLAVGSVALAAAPASAGTASDSGTTRQTVLTIADSARQGDPLSDEALALVARVCKIGIDDGRDIDLQPTYDPDGVDGFLVQALIEPEGSSSSRACTFAALATIRPLSTMTGTATVSAEQFDVLDVQRAAAPSHDFTVSGDVYVTTPVDDISYGDYGSATATGDVVVTEASTTTSSRVVTPKSTTHKRAAYTAYHRTIDTAQAKLARALKKADGSSSKKASARKTYSARKKAAKSRLHEALKGDLTIVVTENPRTTTTPFTFTTSSGCRSINARC